MEKAFEYLHSAPPPSEISPELSQEIDLALEDIARWEQQEASDTEAQTKGLVRRNSATELIRTELLGVATLMTLYPLVTQAVARALEHRK